MQQLDEDLAEAKEQADRAGGVQAYLFDPALDRRCMADTEGLDRLRYIEDRAAASWLYELYWLAQQTGRSRERESHLRDEAARERRLELEWLHNVAKSSFAGAFGRHVKAECESFLGIQNDRGDVVSFRTDETSLRAWVKRVQELDWREGADATRRISK